MNIYARKNKKRQITLFPYTYPFKSSFISSLTHIHVGERNRRNIQSTLCQNFMFISKKYTECALKISTFTKSIGIMHI